MNKLLTSKVVQESPDKNYSWHEACLLVPHEAIRREFMRAQGALNNMNVIKHPWQILYFNKWVKEYFHPAIHEHHMAEEEILYATYTEVSNDSPSPDNQVADHFFLDDFLTHNIKVADKLLTLVTQYHNNNNNNNNNNDNNNNTSTTSSSKNQHPLTSSSTPSHTSSNTTSNSTAVVVTKEDVIAVETELKQSYTTFIEFMMDHLAEEEGEWMHNDATSYYSVVYCVV